MRWHCYQLTYELQSPLHIGYHKVGNLQRTRYYIPGYNLWAAVTEALTRRGFSTNGVPKGNYTKVGEWINEHCAFSYLFLKDVKGHMLSPCFTKEGICYGEGQNALCEADFERRYLGSLVTTALDAKTTSAETSSLHEVEYISPHPLDGDESWTRTQLLGKVFLDNEAHLAFNDMEKWKCWLGVLWVGGERRYGFGKLHLIDFRPIETIEKGEELILTTDRPGLHIAKGNPLPAHALVQYCRAKGHVEPLLSRLTESSTNFGQRVQVRGFCWVPGSILTEPQRFYIDHEMLLRILP